MGITRSFAAAIASPMWQVWQWSLLHSPYYFGPYSTWSIRDSVWTSVACHAMWPTIKRKKLKGSWTVGGEGESPFSTSLKHVTCITDTFVFPCVGGRAIHQNKLCFLHQNNSFLFKKKKNNSCFFLLMWKARTSAFKHMDKDAAAKQSKCHSNLYNLSCYEV